MGETEALREGGERGEREREREAERERERGGRDRERQTQRLRQTQAQTGTVRQTDRDNREMTWRNTSFVPPTVSVVTSKPPRRS